MIERQIIIALIVSTEFCQRIEDRWNIILFESSTAKRIATWVNEYFKKYNKAPQKEIESIFYQKLKAGLPKDLAAEIEEEILPSLSEQYETEELNVDYLVDQAIFYFNERHLKKHSEEITRLLEAGKQLEAEKIANSYKPIAKDSGQWIDLSDKKVLDKLDHAFNKSTDVLITFPGALGKFLNEFLIRCGFVTLMGPSKRGKTFWLLEFAMKACKQKRNVAFFQAGDMTEDEQLMRISIHLTKKSNKEQFCGKMFEPVCDCIFNQLNKCDRSERACDYGIFEGKSEKWLRKEVTMDDLKTEYQDNKDYIPCNRCDAFENNKWGTPWIKEVHIKNPLTSDEAKDAFGEFFIKYSRRFKLSSHTNNTLTVRQIKSILTIWEKQENFIPDVIIIDYADLLTDEIQKEERPKQNAVWKDLRGLSQSAHALIITATQSDADSFEKDTITLKNFSEDKRKWDHVTAAWGLNQDHTGREKDIGIMRLNELLAREGDFSAKHQVHVLQNLRRGRPFIGSYW